MAQKYIMRVRLSRQQLTEVGLAWFMIINYSDGTKESKQWSALDMALAYLVAQDDATRRAGGF